MAAPMTKTMWHACMAYRLSSSWSMQVLEIFAQMLEKSAVLVEIHFCGTDGHLLQIQHPKLVSGAFPRSV